MTTTIKTNSDLLSSKLKSNMYSTYDIGGYLNYEDVDYEDLEIDNPKRIRAVSEKILKHILESDEIEELSKAGITIHDKVISVFSLRKYNFTTDGFDFEITVDEYIMDKYVLSNTKFYEYLKDNYSSCDGFISFMPNTIGEWLSGDYDLERRAMCVVGYILDTMEFEGSELELYEDADDCLIYPTN